MGKKVFEIEFFDSKKKTFIVNNVRILSYDLEIHLS